MKRSILVLFWVFMSATMFAQGGIDVAGIVLDEQGQELIGVSVQIKGKQGVGVVLQRAAVVACGGLQAGNISPRNITAPAVFPFAGSFVGGAVQSGSFLQQSGRFT